LQLPHYGAYSTSLNTRDLIRKNNIVSGYWAVADAHRRYINLEYSIFLLCIGERIQTTQKVFQREAVDRSQ